MKLLSMLPLAALALFLAGCGTAPYEGDPAQSQLAADDAAKRADGEDKGGPMIDDFKPDTETITPDPEEEGS